MRLTPLDGIGGFEPEVLLDGFDNAWVTAHRPYYPLVPDDGSPTGQRQATWLWMSKDGKNFTNPPGSTPVAEHEQYFGDEGDLAVDRAGNVFFIDLGAAYSTFSSWRVDGPGKATHTYSTPLLPAAFATDRPFIAAGGDGMLFITENVGGGLVDRDSSPARPVENGSSGFYVSRDGGRTLTSSLPYTAAGTNFCRPLVDHRNPQALVAACGGDPSPLAFTSRDGGDTWTGQPITANVGYDQEQFPSIAQSPDGTLHALFHNRPTASPADALVGTPALADPFIQTRLDLFSSRDGGRTWAGRDATPEKGDWRLTGLAAAPNGRLGLSGYFRADNTRPWQYRAAVFNLGDRDLASAEIQPGQEVLPSEDGPPPGEFTQPAFDSRSRLHVAYAARDLAYTPATRTKFTGSFTVFYARQSH